MARTRAALHQISQIVVLERALQQAREEAGVGLVGIGAVWPLRGDSAAERAALAPPTQTVWEVLRSHRTGGAAADLGVLRPRCDAPSLAHWEALFRLAARPRGASEYSI